MVDRPIASSLPSSNELSTGLSVLELPLEPAVLTEARALYSEVSRSTLGTSDTIWLVEPWSSQWNENWQGKSKYSEATLLCGNDVTWVGTRAVSVGSCPSYGMG
jgi:hypothetical protein